MSAVEFLPEHGDLRAPAEVMDWFLRGAEDPPQALAGTGALAGGALHPRLDAARAVIRSPVAELWLERGDRRGRGWIADGLSVLLHPLGDGRLRLITVRSPLIVDALVRLNDVGPRPRFEPAVRISLAPGELAEALATREPRRARLGGADQTAAFERVMSGLREHWRVAAAWEPADGALGGRDLEVLDTEDGYWLVIPDDPTVELWPTTPTAVYRSLAGLLPSFAEVRT
jgi:hypothetical protein